MVTASRPEGGAEFGAYCIVGMTNSAPSLTPLGHREVMVLVLV
jgi:hypothetical protein